MRRLLSARVSSLGALCALCLTLSACQDPEPEQPKPQPADLGEQGEDMAPDLEADLGEVAIKPPSSWTVRVAQDAPEAVMWTAQDVADYLKMMGLSASVETVSAATTLDCAPGSGVVAFLGEEAIGAPQWSTLTPNEQSWSIQEQRCADQGALVRLGGGGLLGRQYAAYEWLNRLGVRFFHPEQEFVPAQPAWSQAPLSLERTPAFRWRSASLHLTHPLELGDVFNLKKPELMEEGKRYIDWQIKNGASYGTTGYGDGERASYGLKRGFKRTAGFSLHNQQQGGRAVIDPDDPRPVEDQIADAIDERMGNDPNDYPEFFSFTFNPSEFTELDDREAVAQLTFIADYMAVKYPKTIVYTINHGTHGEPTEHYGVRFYDLPKFAPPSLGVSVHTLMFYDLFRPAPVYGNEDFNYLFDFMVDQYQTRALWYFPESAWWLTFDNAVPLYLPITLEARDRDIQSLAFMLKGKLDGHRVFGSGHEWGYWQNEYCSYRMAADLSYRLSSCLDEITSPMGQAAPVVKAALLEAIRFQERDFIYDPELMRYLVGSDPETEIALSVGVHFHPLPPAPAQIMGWDEPQTQRWLDQIAPRLERAAQDYEGLVAKLNAARERVPEAGLPWFNEVVDGLEVNGLRARHGLEVYGAAVLLRQSQLRFSQELRTRAEQSLAKAKETTDAAIAVIRRREQGYRYKPLDRAIAGGPDGTEDENWTIYKFRVHNRAHHAYYYRRPERLVEELFSGRGEVAQVQDVVLGPDEQLVLDVLAPDLSGLSLDLGDGEQARSAHVEHSYAQPGIYTVKLEATSAQGQPVTWSVQVAVVQDEAHTGFSGDIKAPKTVDIIEPVMPALVWGKLDDERYILGFSAASSGAVMPGQFSALSLDPASPTLRTKAARQLVPVINKMTATIQTTIVVDSGVLTRDAADDAPLVFSGQMVTDSIVDAIVAVGGFEPDGARRLVSRALGYTPSTLPATVPFLVEYTLMAAP